MRMKENWFPIAERVQPVSASVATRSKDRRNPRGGDRRNYYLGSWISARRSGNCVKCGSDIIHGDTVKWIPCSRRLLCYSCGQHEGQAVLNFVNGRIA